MPQTPEPCIARLHAVAQTSREMALEMEFAFLLDDDRKLLSIGYLASEGHQDPNCYDLLASEARLASFLAIAKGEVPARHWFRLGHAVTPVPGGPVLISWSGSMFEYLMPTLVMRSPAGSLLERTERRVVTRQIEYGRQQDLPWGISESAFNARDLEFTYQYSNFGVPGLGLKRGLGENKVIAPYATALGAMIEPQAALRNFRRIEAAGGLGRYGFYEALDYTPSRVPADRNVAVVRTFMAHHQGMTIVALANTVLDGVMRDRFHAEPMVKSAELLLQERMPRQIAVTFQAVAEEGKAAAAGQRNRAPRRPAFRKRRRRGARDASAVQRPLYGHAHRGGIGPEPLARPGGDALARGYHLRRLGFVHLSAGRREQRRLVRRLSAHRKGARTDTASCSTRIARNTRDTTAIWSPR